MANYHHKPIKKFNLSGDIHDESAIGRLKTEYIRLIVSQMKLTGYVPRFDIEPDFTIDYNEKKRKFEFELTVYGIYVGRKKSEWILGIDGQKPIYTRKNKSKEFSQEQV
jgi:hypothetical protein